MTHNDVTATALDVSRLADEAITEYLQAADVGEAPTRSDFIQRHQQVRSALESFFDVYDQMEGSLQSDEVSSFAAGGQLGRHRLVRPIGSGSFGTVWLGFDTQLKRPVAIKLPRRDRFSSQKQRDLFLSEAQTVAQLDHPNIIPIYDVGETKDGEIYLVSRFVAGNDLATEMRTRRFTHDEAAVCVSRIADALDYAHRRNVLHRDIKPSNILLDAETGQPYVTDFGLACNVETNGDSGIAGTPSYMSPEQASGTKLDHRSDVFSVSVLFYELLFGMRPFWGENASDIMRSIREGSPRSPGEQNQHVPAQLQQVCLKALSKLPDDRYRDMAEFKSALTSSMSSESAKPTASASKPDRWPIGTLVVGGLVLALSLVCGVIWLGGGDKADETKPRQGSTSSDRSTTAATTSSTGKSIDREVAEETIRLGGHIDFRFEDDDHEVDSIDDIPDGDISLLWVMFADRQTLSDEYFDRLTQLDSLEGIDVFSCSFSPSGFARIGEIESLRVVQAPSTNANAEVAALAKLPRLHKLTLTSTKVSNETLRAFEGNSTLKQLRLSETAVTDEGLRLIGSMTAIDNLSVDSCQISDAGVKHLSSLRNLTTAKFAQTGITDKALGYLDDCPIIHLVIPDSISKQAEEKFLTKHPGCRVIRD